MPEPRGSRKVLIVGGGPGGMQAAIDACDRGHQVILADSANRLGGTLRLTDFDYYKKDLYNFKEMLVREVEKRDIEVWLNTHITEKDIGTTAPEAVILALGAEPLLPDLPGIEMAMPASTTYFLPDTDIGDKVVMVGGGLVGCEVGLELAHRGKDVLVIGRNERLAKECIGIHRTALLDHMEKIGVRYMVGTECKEIKKDGVIVRSDEGEELFIAADTVVIGLGNKVNQEAVERLEAAAGNVPVFKIGDCDSPARVGKAVQEGYMAAMSIV